MTGLLRHWCAGCDRLTLGTLMGWLDGGLYRCALCRGVGPSEAVRADIRRLTREIPARRSVGRYPVP